MPRYRYQARSKAGALLEGDLEAGSPPDAARRLRQEGHIPVKIQPASEGTDRTEGPGERRPKGARGRPGIDDLELFCRQMHSLTRAGVPIVRALRGVAETTHNRVLASALREVAGALEAGRDLSAAMHEQGKVFPMLMINMVRMGEQTGRLDETFKELSFYLERERNTRQQIKQAVRYPIFVIVAIVAAVAIINVFVIPAFADMFQRFDAELPLPTRILMATSDFTLAYWPHMIVGAGVALFGFRFYINGVSGRLWWDSIKLRIPIVGSIMRRALLARFARGLTMATRSGVPVLQGLDSVGRAVDNAYMAERVEQMSAALERGETLLAGAAGTRMFTPLVLQMIAIGEETGQLDEMMEEVARFYEQEVDYELKNLSSSIEPILISIVGVMVLILALGVFLPMWDLGAAAL